MGENGGSVYVVNISKKHQGIHFVAAADPFICSFRSLLYLGRSCFISALFSVSLGQEAS
jgi:hypothetical protein